MQALDVDNQSLGGAGGGFLGGGSGWNNPLAWLITLGFLKGDNFLGGNNAQGAVGVSNATGIAENSAKIDCLAQGQGFLQNSLNQQSSAAAFSSLNDNITNLSNIEREQTAQLSSIARDTQDTIFRESSAMQRALADCCCDLEKGQAQIETAIAMQTNTITNNANANTQRILDDLCQSRLADKDAQINNLQRELSTAETVNRVTSECGCCNGQTSCGNGNGGIDVNVLLIGLLGALTGNQGLAGAMNAQAQS